MHEVSINNLVYFGYTTICLISLVFTEGKDIEQGIRYTHSNSIKILNIRLNCIRGRDGPWPDPTRAHFWPAVNKRPTRLWPGYFPTRPVAIFFDPKWKKLKNLMFLGEIFRILTQTINSWPDPSHKKLTWPDPGQKCLTRTHH